MQHQAEPGKTKIGWIGTGVMGKSMAGHLLAAGYEVTLYSRTAPNPTNSWLAEPNGPPPRSKSPKPRTSSSPWSATRTTSAR